MKTPKTKAKPGKTLASKTAETVLSDSWQARVQKGATPGIFPMMWRDGFAVGHGTCRKFSRALRVFRYDQPHEHNGKKLHWAVEGVDYAEDKNTVLKIWGQTWFETKEHAEAELPKFVALAKADANRTFAAQVEEEAHKPTSDEQDLKAARLKVMREQFPDTFKAMDNLSEAKPEVRPEATENLFRAYAVDLVRFYKPEKLGEISPFKVLPTDKSFIVQLAKAFSAKSPYDPVDVEIAANWFAKGYDKMTLDEYTKAINEKTGAYISPDAMEKRRYAKLGLMTKKPPGPHPKS